MKKYLILLLLSALPNFAYAGNGPKWGAPESEVAACVSKAANAFGVVEAVVWTLLDVESGTIGRVSMNTNGSYDIGPMQINSIHLPRLRKLGINEYSLKNNLCTNINVGTWIYAQEYAATRDVAKAIARYHSRTPKFQSRYLGLAINALNRRIDRQLKSPPQFTPVTRSVAPTLASAAPQAPK